MLLSPRQPNSGIALIIVLIVIMVLGILAGGFAYSMRVETKLARNDSFEAELEWMGRSGIELARYVLAQSGRTAGGAFDSLNQRWAGGPGDTNDPTSLIPLENCPLGPGSISVRIKDLDRKFNINAADEMILGSALALIGVDAAAFPSIIDCILDWRDPDNENHMNGTESDHYKTLYPPYLAKNGAIDDLSELLLVNGITPAMYFGSAGGSHAPFPRAPGNLRRSNFDEPVYTVGLADLFTTLSSGRVNINTADAVVLQLIPEIGPEITSSIISGPMGRAGPDGADGTEDDTPFRSVQELIRVPGMSPNAIEFLNRFFGVRSAVFEVTVEVRIGNLSRQYVATLRRGGNPRDTHMLFMYWK